MNGVKVGQSDLQIPLGAQGYTVAADWYFPTQADGSVSATGVIWLQHGFCQQVLVCGAGDSGCAQQTNSIVVGTERVVVCPLRCADCSLNSVPMQQAVATMFLGDRAALNTSATSGGLPGQAAGELRPDRALGGRGLATAVGGFYTDAAAPTNNGLLGVVMFDGVSSSGPLPPPWRAWTPYIPVLSDRGAAAAWNANGDTTNDLVALRPGQFVGAILAKGSHVDSLIGAVPIIDSSASW